jgi:hypothetical protein
MHRDHEQISRAGVLFENDAQSIAAWSSLSELLVHTHTARLDALCPATSNQLRRSGVLRASFIVVSPNWGAIHSHNCQATLPVTYGLRRRGLDSVRFEVRCATAFCCCKSVCAIHAGALDSYVYTSALGQMYVSGAREARVRVGAACISMYEALALGQEL